MKSFALAVAASLAMFGSASAEVAYEPLVVVSPQPLVERSDEARALIADVNRFREHAGLADLAVDETLARAALNHARDMAARRYFGHFSPEGISFTDRLDRAGIRWTVAAENIALEADELHAHAALVHSPDHRANMLDPRVRKIGVAALGVGVGAALYVEDFVL